MKLFFVLIFLLTVAISCYKHDDSPGPCEEPESASISFNLIDSTGTSVLKDSSYVNIDSLYGVDENGLVNDLYIINDSTGAINDPTGNVIILREVYVVGTYEVDIFNNSTKLGQFIFIDDKDCGNSDARVEWNGNFICENCSPNSIYPLNIDD